MRLAHADRRPGPRQPRNGNRIWLVTCVVTVVVVVFVAVKLTGSGCPAAPRAGGSAAAAVAGVPAGPAGQGGPAGHAGTGLLAARPAPARSVIEGHAVFYDPGQASGSCGLGPFPAGGWYASLPPRGYASGRACGSYLDVFGPAGPVRAEVVDVCTGCAAGTVDLSRAAFARIASPRRGTVAVSYQAAVDPPLPGPLTLRISAAERTGTLAVQVINHGNRLSSVAARGPGGRWERLVPSADGYWTGPLHPGRPGITLAAGGTAAAVAGGGTGPAPRGRISVRVTDVAGHRVLLTGISLRRTVLHASAWMYRARRPPASREARTPAAASARASRARPAVSAGSC
jgi:expansin (peptidoglycan-binding protein)